MYVAWIQDFSLLNDRIIDYNMPTEVIGEYETIEEATEALSRYMILEKERFKNVWNLLRLDFDYCLKHYHEISHIKNLKKRFFDTADPDSEFLEDLLKIDNIKQFFGKCHTNVCEKENLTHFDCPIVYNYDWD